MIEGRVLGGRYQIQDKVGSGGMAAVFRGIDSVLGRTVAIKVMLPQYASDPTFAARFRQEAQAAAALTSPYIVGVYDWGQDGDTYYIVMEYIRGTDLKSGIRTHGALAPRKVAQIGAQVCAALSVAHRHEIIHRDIKPQNIMIQPDGTAKVMDFGIARAKNSHLTQTNSVLGTAHYVSPEQTQGKELDAESDLYSLGVVMYEAATGRVPFDGDEAIAVALKQVNETPIAPSQINPKIDPEFEAIILKCMEKDPRQRFHSADELRRILNNYIAGRPTGLIGKNCSQGQTPTTVMATSSARSIAPLDSTRVLPKREIGNRVVGGAAYTNSYEVLPEQPQKKPVWPIVAGALAAIIVLVLAVVYLLSNAQGSTKAVPNLIGYDETQASQAITQAGFTKGAVSTEYSESAPSGTVIDQDPDQGIQRPAHTKINITLSKGPAPKESVLIPDIKNMDQVAAEKILRDKKLVPVGGGTAYDENVPAGKIVSQNPAAGTKAVEGDKVSYVISLGTENKNIPNVVGKKLDNAKSELESAGFKVSVSEESSATVDKGRVISQTPASGTAAKDSTISLVVSKGSNEVEIPKVVGKNKDKAISELQRAGFKVKIEEMPNSANQRVVRQSPPEGSKAAPGSTVVITIDSGFENGIDEPVGDQGSNNSSHRD